MKRLILVAALALPLGGCFTFAPTSILDNPNIAAGVNQAVEGTSAAAKKANAGIDKICANYELVDAAFQLIALAAGDRIPQPYRDAEADAVRYLADLCTHRPTNAQEALESAQKAYATIIVVRDHFKAK